MASEGSAPPSAGAGKETQPKPADATAEAPSMKSISLSIEFRCLELLFDKQKEMDIKVPVQGESLTLDSLIMHIKDEYLKERPGVLVLVNDADWEIEGKGEYEVQDGDAISFISTLHGG
ncbi:URM1 [Symbiodinium sp. KB8]|nr:URM1 [Symbiodinium sp. KB8]